MSLEWGGKNKNPNRMLKVLSGRKFQQEKPTSRHTGKLLTVEQSKDSGTTW